MSLEQQTKAPAMLGGALISARVVDRLLEEMAHGAYAGLDRLPPELELAARLGVSRTTLREGIRILSSRNVLEIRRGRGTFVAVRGEHEPPIARGDLLRAPVNVKSLYEMRLMVEPQTAYYAAKRASQEELERILTYGEQEEREIAQGKDRTKTEQAFHKSIAMAAHNEFVERLLPIIYEAIDSGVRLSEERAGVVQDTRADHRMLMNALRARDALAARAAMELHILHAMRAFGIQDEAY